MRLVKSECLEEEKAKLADVTSLHVYSVSQHAPAAQGSTADELWAASYHVRNPSAAVTAVGE